MSWGEGNVHGQLAGSGIIRGQFSSAGRLARTNCSGDNYPKSCPASCNMIAYHAIPPKHLFQLSCQKRSYAAILPSGKSLSRKVYEISIKTIGFLTNFSTNNRRCPRFFISNLPLVSCNPLEVLWLETYLFFISFFENNLPLWLSSLDTVVSPINGHVKKRTILIQRTISFSPAIAFFCQILITKLYSKIGHF